MNIERKIINICEETLNLLEWPKENLETFKIQIKKYIYAMNNLIDIDLNKLSDEEFCSLISEIYNVYIDDEDCLKILSKKNKKKYNMFTEITTKMTYEATATEGHGKNFSWWNQIYQVVYEVAVSEDISIDSSKDYNSKEIEEMIIDKNIVIVGRKSIPVEEKIENYKEFKITTMDDIRDENITSILRRKFTKKKILKDMQDVIDELEIEIDDTLSSSNNEKSVYYETSKLCDEWFNKSEEKKEYEHIKSKVKA